MFRNLLNHVQKGTYNEETLLKHRVSTFRLTTRCKTTPGNQSSCAGIPNSFEHVTKSTVSLRKTNAKNLKLQLTIHFFNLMSLVPIKMNLNAMFDTQNYLKLIEMMFFNWWWIKIDL